MYKVFLVQSRSCKKNKTFQKNVCIPVAYESMLVIRYFEVELGHLGR